MKNNKNKKMSNLLTELPPIATISNKTVSTGCGTQSSETLTRIEDNCDTFEELFEQNIFVSTTTTTTILSCDENKQNNVQSSHYQQADIVQERQTGMIRTKRNESDSENDKSVNYDQRQFIRETTKDDDAGDCGRLGNKNKQISSDHNANEHVNNEQYDSETMPQRDVIEDLLNDVRCQQNESCHWFCENNNYNINTDEHQTINSSSDHDDYEGVVAVEDGDNREIDPNHRRHQASSSLSLSSLSTSNLLDMDRIYPQYEYPNVSRAVIQSEYVKNAIEESYNEAKNNNTNRDTDSLKSEEEIKSEYKKLAFTHYRRLRSTISSSLLKIASWILYRLLSRIFTSITFNRSQIDSIRTCDQRSQQNEDAKSTPIVYLPIHRSHLDAILVSWILYMNNIRPPLVAAGDNMMIPFFGNLMRGLGAFFIKRPEGTKTSDGKNHLDKVYQAVLRSYIVENLKAGMSIGIFLEGGRSRTGKILPPKYGLLSIIIDALEQGILDDVYIVPVSISYEKVVDGTFVDESLGKPKAFESFVRASKAIWKTMHSRFGNVRVDFNAPFRLSEYLSQHQHKLECNNNSVISGVLPHNSSVDSAPIQLSACVACSSSITKPSLEYSLEQTVYSKQDRAMIDERAMESNNMKLKSRKFDAVMIETQTFPSRSHVESLGRHVLLNAANKSAIMPTHLISFLLLNKYRNGVTLEQLTNDAQCITTFLQREKSINIAYGHGRPTNGSPNGRTLSGSSLSSKNPVSRSQAVESALSHLGQDLILIEKSFVKWTLKKGGAGSKPASTSITQNGFAHFKQAYQNRSQSRILPNELADSLTTPVTTGTTSVDDSRGIEMIYIKPILNIRSALELHYYANNCTYSMLYESILANALFSFITVDLSALICDSSSYISNLTIDKQEFLRRSMRLCHVFQYEFILDKSCQSVETEMEETFQRFVSKNIFVPVCTKSSTITTSTASGGRFAYRSHSTNDSARIRRRASLEVIDEEELDDDDVDEGSDEEKQTSEQFNDSNTADDEMDQSGNNSSSNSANNNNTNNSNTDFRLLLTSRNIQLLNFYAAILSPFLESYWQTAEQLALLADADPSKEYEEKHVHRQLCLNLQQLYQKSQLKHAEAVSMTTIRNAINYFAIESLKKIRCPESRRSIIRFEPDTSICDPNQRPIRLAAKELRSYCTRFNM